MLDSGARSSRRALTVCVLPTQAQTRVGFVCGRRFGGAVDRNRCRRIMRAAWAQLLPRVRAGFDVVVIARAPALTATSREAATELEDALQRLGALAR